MGIIKQSGSKNFIRIRARMTEYGYDQKRLAEELNITTAALGSKLNARSEFKRNEMQKIIELLEIPPAEIDSYFFANVLQKRNKSA